MEEGGGEVPAAAREAQGVSQEHSRVQGGRDGLFRLFGCFVMIGFEFEGPGAWVGGPWPALMRDFGLWNAEISGTPNASRTLQLASEPHVRLLQPARPKSSKVQHRMNGA